MNRDLEPLLVCQLVVIVKHHIPTQGELCGWQPKEHRDDGPGLQSICRRQKVLGVCLSPRRLDLILYLSLFFTDKLQPSLRRLACSLTNYKL